MAGLELAWPRVAAGLRFVDLKVLSPACQALEESMLHMGRRDGRTWRGKVS